MSGLADRMQNLDLIERRRDEEDGRAWRLWLTDDGRVAAEHSKESLKEINTKLTEGFSEEEIDVVARWLSSLRERFPLIDEA